MLDRPLVSVGLPTFNRAERLKRAIESVMAQDYDRIELVISDNASTDETEALCRKYGSQDSRIKYIRQPANRGVTANFQEVLSRSVIALRHIKRGEFAVLGSKVLRKLRSLGSSR